jgi:signal transduction histidine kinase
VQLKGNLRYFNFLSFFNRLGRYWIDTKVPFTEHFNKSSGLVDDNVWSIFEDSESNIWLGTYNGINIYNPKTKKLKEFGAGQGYQEEQNGATNTIIEYEKDKLLLGGSGGFYLFDKKKQSLKRYGVSQGFRNANKAIQGNEKNIWISSENLGLCSFNYNTNLVKTIDESIDLVSSSTFSLLNDKKGNIWVGTTSGIFILNPKKNTYRTLSATKGLISDEIMTMELNGDGDIYVGTSSGISVINTTTETITNIGESEGLIPEMTFDLISLDSTVYAGTLDGLIEVNKPISDNENWTFNNFNVQNGMPNTDFNQDVSISLKNGELWLGVYGNTPNLTVFRKRSVVKKEPLTTHITGLSIMDEDTDFKRNARFLKYLSKGDTIWLTNNRDYFNTETLPKDSDYLSVNNIKWDSTYGYYSLPANLVLPYNQNALNFSFNNNSVIGNKRIVYKYFLEGSDTEWLLGGAAPLSKNYYNLKAGNYTFKVISKAINGIWTEPAKFSFTILPPWWQIWWAYVLYGLIAAGLLRVYILLRSRKLTKENHVLEEKVGERTRELESSLESLKSTQTQLVQSEKMASLGELTAGMAHEIQNPLNFVNNFSEVSSELLTEMKEELTKGNIKEVLAITDDLDNNLNKINHHGNRASSIVKGMLEHSRASTGQKELIDINVLTDEYFRLAYHGLRAKDKSFNAELITQFDEGLPKVNVVPQDLGRVILNLINNAFYAAASKTKDVLDDSFRPRVSVSTRRVGENVVVSITDNGIGIPEEMKDKIFQPFFTTKPSGKGTGLGLSLAYDIVKAHGGNLSFESNEDVGTAFVLTIPHLA